MNITSPYIISLQKQIDNCKQEILPEEKLLKSLTGAGEGVTPSVRDGLALYISIRVGGKNVQGG